MLNPLKNKDLQITNIYSLGCLFYTIMTGQRIYEGIIEGFSTANNSGCNLSLSQSKILLQQLQQVNFTFLHSHQ
jgi:hypothetical protein